jgi:hypothetical protein
MMNIALNNLLNRPAFKWLPFPTLVIVAIGVGLLAAMMIPVTVR